MSEYVTTNITSLKDGKTGNGHFRIESMILHDMQNVFELSYLANKYFKHRMLIDRVALKLVYLVSTGSAADLLLEGIICYKEKIDQNLSLSPFH